MSTPKVPLAGVCGSPAGHSLSPRLFRYWLQRHAIAGHYVPLDVDQKDLAAVLDVLPKMGFVGLNVTLPHKVAVLALADSVSDRASIIGAANTLTWGSDQKLYADNTDGEGFLGGLKNQAPYWSPDDGPAVVFGAGGAARAVLSALLSEGVREIRLSNRTRSRADVLRAEFGNRIKVIDWVQAGHALEGAALVVNTTSLGMRGKEEFRVPLEKLSSDSVVADIVYTPLETDLLAAAKKRGCVPVDGLGMLLHQAVPGFERWFGERPQVDVATRDWILSA